MIAVQGLTWTSTWVAAPESRDGVVVRVLVASVALLPLVPMVRVFVGPVPLYLTDALLVALAAVILRPNRLERRERRLLGVGAACLAATVPSLVIALVAGDEPAFTLYYYGRRVLALASFATFLALFAGPPARRRLAVGALMAGTLVAGVWCVGQVLTRSTGAVGAVDHVYYDRLFQAGREVAVDRWAAAWKTPRAIAGWWNANVAGAALALGLAIVAGAGAGRLTVATLGVAWVGLFATASRQALLGAALVTGVLAFERGTRRGRLQRSPTPVRAGRRRAHRSPSCSDVGPRAGRPCRAPASRSTRAGSSATRCCSRSPRTGWSAWLASSPCWSRSRATRRGAGSGVRSSSSCGSSTATTISICRPG